MLIQLVQIVYLLWQSFLTFNVLKLKTLFWLCAVVVFVIESVWSWVVWAYNRRVAWFRPWFVKICQVFLVDHLVGVGFWQTWLHCFCRKVFIQWSLHFRIVWHPFNFTFWYFVGIYQNPLCTLTSFGFVHVWLGLLLNQFAMAFLWFILFDQNLFWLVDRCLCDVHGRDLVFDFIIIEFLLLFSFFKKFQLLYLRFKYFFLNFKYFVFAVWSRRNRVWNLSCSDAFVS